MDSGLSTIFLQSPAQRSGTKGRVKPELGQPIRGLLGSTVNIQAMFLQPLVNFFHLKVNNLHPSAPPTTART